jgi:hypothetical protein
MLVAADQPDLATAEVCQSPTPPSTAGNEPVM